MFTLHVWNSYSMNTSKNGLFPFCYEIFQRFHGKIWIYLFCFYFVSMFFTLPSLNPVLIVTFVKSKQANKLIEKLDFLLLRETLKRVYFYYYFLINFFVLVFRRFSYSRVCVVNWYNPPSTKMMMVTWKIFYYCFFFSRNNRYNEQLEYKNIHFFDYDIVSTEKLPSFCSKSFPAL